MLTDLVKAVLTLVVGFLLHLFFVAINVVIDPVIFDTIVAGVVLWFVVHLGYGLTLKILPYSLVERGFLKE